MMIKIIDFVLRPILADCGWGEGEKDGMWECKKGKECGRGVFLYRSVSFVEFLNESFGASTGAWVSGM